MPATTRSATKPKTARSATKAKTATTATPPTGAATTTLGERTPAGERRAKLLALKRSLRRTLARLKAADADPAFDTTNCEAAYYAVWDVVAAIGDETRTKVPDLN